MHHTRMLNLRMTLQRRSLQLGETFKSGAGHHAIWLQSGAINFAGRVIQAREGAYVSGRPVVARSETTLLHYSMAAASVPVDAQVMLTAKFNWPERDAVLRLDQVSFPPGAQAFRHVHPGAGIRFLFAGQLEIQSDHHTETATPGSAWFEDANSPVRATAGPEPTSFIRAMVLPLEFGGKPTLNILDPEDAAKPRLQTNRLFFDQRVSFRAD